LGDALRAVRALGVSDSREVRAICELILGTSAPPTAQREPAPPSLDRVAPAVVAPPQPAIDPATVALAPGVMPDVPSQLIEIQHRPHEHDAAGAGQSGAQTALEAESDEEWRAAPESLFRASVERSIAREIAAAFLPSATIDVDQLVEAMAKIELPRDLPYVSESTTRRGVQLLLDRSARLDGLAFDVQQLERRFVSLLGEGSVEALRFREFPSIAGAGPADTWTPYRPPAPFVPIVVVTAFSASNERVWDALVKRWARQQRTVTFLVPHGAERVPRSVAAVARVVPWDRPTTARSVRHAKPEHQAIEPTPPRSADPLDRLRRKNPDAARLARYASLAAYVEPALLRELRLRLLPKATPAAELDLWTSDVAASKSRDGFTLAARVLDRLRQQAAVDGRLSAALAIVKRIHAQAPPLLRLEERLIALSLGPAKDLTEASIQAELEPVLAAMERSPVRTKNLARWFARTVARLPPAIVSSDMGRLLGCVTAAHVPGAPAVKVLPSDSALRRAAALLPKEREAPIAVRWRGPGPRPGLELKRLAEGSRVDERWHLLRVTRCDPLIVWVDDKPVSVGFELVHVEIAMPQGRLGENATTIRDVAGKRWELAPLDDQTRAIAIVRGRSKQGIAYLFDTYLCFTAPDAIDTDQVNLEFSWGTVPGRAGLDRTTPQWAMIALDKPVTPAPLQLGPDPQPDDIWEIALSPSQRLRGHGAVQLTNEVGMRLLLARPFTDQALSERIRGAPVFVNGHVAGHVAFVAPPGSSEQSIVMCRSSLLRSAWAGARKGTHGVLGRRLASGMTWQGRDEVVPGIAVGRRTFLFESGSSLSVVMPAVERVRQVSEHRFGGTVLAVSVGESQTPFVGDDIWPGVGLEDIRLEDTALTPQVDIDFPSQGAAPTFVCVPASGGFGVELLPCPVHINASDALEVSDLDGAEPRLRSGLPVFERGRMVGIIARKDDLRVAAFAEDALPAAPRRARIHTMVDVVRDVALEVLEARDWARLARRLRQEPSMPEIEISATAPHSILAAINLSRSRVWLQFALDQSVRRLEASEPERYSSEPEPQLRAELALAHSAPPGASGVVVQTVSHVTQGSPEYPIRLSIASKTPMAMYTHATYRLYTSWAKKPWTVQNGENGFPLEIMARGDCEVLVEIGDKLSIVLRARLCDLLDERYLHQSSEEIEDAIDDLRRR
jgi:hypothetical protein